MSGNTWVTDGEYSCGGGRQVYTEWDGDGSTRIIEVRNGDQIQNPRGLEIYINSGLGCGGTERMHRITWCYRCAPDSSRPCDRQTSNNNQLDLQPYTEQPQDHAVEPTPQQS